jgi:phthiocerol/phenolphthiocerol synthesis type-I polyketide synthase D
MSRSAQEITDWLVARVSDLTGLPPEEIDVQAPLSRSGLDSVAVVALASDLETWLGYRFHANPLEDHPTIASLASFLAEQVGTREKE